MDTAESPREGEARARASQRLRRQRDTLRPLALVVIGAVVIGAVTVKTHINHIFQTTGARDRARALPGWLRWYNNHRPHGSLQGHPPITRGSGSSSPRGPLAVGPRCV